MAFYNTYVNYNGNGSQRDFSVPFSYLDQSEVVVTFSGSGTYTYVFTSPNVIRTTPAVASGDSIRIARQTSLTTAKTVFSNGASLTADALNKQINQLLYGVQEFSDVVAGNMTTDLDGNWTAANKRIKNLSEPLLPFDAVTKGYVDALSIQGGTISSSITKTTVNHSGTGSQTTFALPIAPSVSDWLGVFISGAYQSETAYTITGSSIIFTSAPPAGTNNIEIRIIRILGVYVNQDVNTSQIVNGAVTTAKIADANVTTAKLADGAITSAKIADGTIATADIADGSITSAKIADGTIASGDIADSAVITSKINGGAATLAKLDTTGTNGFVLTANGSGNAPSWQSADSLKLLGTINTTSGNSVSLSGLNLTGYKYLYVVFNNITTNNATAQTLYISPNNVQTGYNVNSVANVARFSIDILDLTSGVGGSRIASLELVAEKHNITNASTIIYFRLGSTVAYTAGTITVYGVK